jgi:hypothetical protein
MQDGIRANYGLFAADYLHQIPRLNDSNRGDYFRFTAPHMHCLRNSLPRQGNVVLGTKGMGCANSFRAFPDAANPKLTALSKQPDIRHLDAHCCTALRNYDSVYYLQNKPRRHANGDPATLAYRTAPLCRLECIHALGLKAATQPT